MITSLKQELPNWQDKTFAMNQGPSSIQQLPAWLNATQPTKVTANVNIIGQDLMELMAEFSFHFCLVGKNTDLMLAFALKYNSSIVIAMINPSGAEDIIFWENNGSWRTRFLQKPQYWLCKWNGSLSSMRKNFNYLCHLAFEKWWKMQIYFPKCNSRTMMPKISEKWQL